jgi:hypothetical protein
MDLRSARIKVFLLAAKILVSKQALEWHSRIAARELAFGRQVCLTFIIAADI